MVKIKCICISWFLLASLASCASWQASRPGAPLNLAAFNENGVAVSIVLQVDASGQSWLAATFDPPKGYHVYSKDLPREGIYGEGRPTRLELPAGSTLQAVGALTESADPEVSSMGTDALLVYPAGPVTLSLPVRLPAGSGWAQEALSITYEACSDTTCMTPVVDKLVPVRMPEAGRLNG
ncbi:MAG TPA: protein-disulfide reductase DsbD domain-containing protein [Anaerolineales bacterium]|nr:protein-disulfide reductase DsbD domain-containing protein [Anaerolineales bacterium]